MRQDRHSDFLVDVEGHGCFLSHLHGCATNSPMIPLREIPSLHHIEEHAVPSPPDVHFQEIGYVSAGGIVQLIA